MDDFFHIISRFIIVIPIATVIIALIIKFNQPAVVSPQKIAVSPTIVSSPSPVVTQIDLTGPWSCQFSSAAATIAAFIKDKKIAAAIQNGKQTNNIIINGDCFYSYMQGAYSGEKVCGISTYLNLFNVLPLNMLDNNLLKNVGFNLPLNINDLKKGLNSCRKEAIKDESIFDVPKNILFKNK